MGIIRRQALFNTIINYAGAAIGALNYIYLLPKFFPTEYIGLIRLIFSIVFILQHVSSLGLRSALTKFFPYYREDFPKQRFFLFFIFKILLASTFIVAGIYILFKPLFLKMFLEKSPLYIHYFYYVLPVFIGQAVYYLVDSLAQVLYKTTFTNFISQIFARIILTSGILASLIYKISPEEAVKFYFLAYSFVMLLGIPILFFGEHKLKFSGKTEKLSWQLKKEWLKYGGFVLLSGTANMLLTTIDSLMLGSYLGLKSVGVYSIYMYMATMLLLPTRALGKIALAFLADAMAKKDFASVLRIYRRTSLIQSSLGLLLFFGILLNMDLFYHIIQKKEFYEGNTIWVFVFLGLGFWIDITGGINGYIVYISDKYKYDLYFTTSLGILNILFNFFFIKFWGITGAALATALSYGIINFLRWYFLKKTYRLQPYDKTFSFVVLSGILAYGIVAILPKFFGIWINSFIKSTLFVLLYFFPMLYFKWIPDYNDFLNLLISKIKSRL